MASLTISPLFVSSQLHIAPMFKGGRQDLATIDAENEQFQRMIKELMQEQAWAKPLPSSTKAHNTLPHGALMGDAGPNEAYDLDQVNLQLELR